jgi:Kef-type K+ transport system membrane component KefB
MPDVSFGSLLIVAAIAAAAPLLIGLTPRLRIPAVVLEIVAGIVVGPAGLGWVRIDLPIQILSLLGLAFLLFLAGLEIDLNQLRGRLLKLAGVGYLVTIGLGLIAGFVFYAVGYVKSPLLIAIALSATSLGLVVPVLKDSGQADKQVGQLTIAGATVADFAAVVLLSLFFSTEATKTSTKVLLLVGLALFVVLLAVGLTRLGRNMRLGAVLYRLQDTTAEIRVRLAVLLLIGFVALAEKIGVETILAAFLAGAVLGMVDRDTATHPHFRLKLDAIAYGFVVPVFFVTSGLRFDLNALFDSPSALARIPLFLLAILLVRAVPAALYVRTVGRRAAAAAGLLQATTLPFLVTATQIGLLLGRITPVTSAALVAAGLLSVVIFPPIALGLLRRSTTADDAAPQPPQPRPELTVASSAMSATPRSPVYQPE